MFRSKIRLVTFGVILVLGALWGFLSTAIYSIETDQEYYHYIFESKQRYAVPQLAALVLATQPASSEEDNIEKERGAVVRISDFSYYAKLEDIPNGVRQAFTATWTKNFFRSSSNEIVFAPFFFVMRILVPAKGNNSNAIRQMIEYRLPSQLATEMKGVNESLLRFAIERSIEKNASSEQIMETFLNTVPFAKRVNGVGAAAKYYFGKSTKELTVSEGALLAGISLNPNDFDPFRYKGRAKQAQKNTLLEMKKNNFISKTEVDRYSAFPLTYTLQERWYTFHGYDITWHKTQCTVEKEYGECWNPTGAIEATKKRVAFRSRCLTSGGNLFTCDCNVYLCSKNASH